MSAEDKYHCVPCGKCSQCLKLRISNWVFRLKQENKYSHSCHFITLTYNDDHIPITKNGYYTLDKKQLRSFFNKLRREQTKWICEYYGWKKPRCVNRNLWRRLITYRFKKYKIKKPKYFAVGEYGTLTQRPHYHMIMFNLADDALINSSWNKGFVDVQPLKHDGGLVYVVSYILGLKHSEHREPEFSQMSKNLGLEFLTPQMVKWYQEDPERQYVQDGAYRKALPRYYRDKIYSEEDRKYIGEVMKYLSDQKIEKIINKLLKRGYENAEAMYERRTQLAKHCKIVEKIKL